MTSLKTIILDHKFNIDGINLIESLSYELV
jgi:hypothetical protein